MLIYVSSAKKTYVFRKGCHVCDFCENDARFPWVELIYFPNNSVNFDEKRTNSLKFYEKRTNSLNIHEKRTFSEKKGVVFANSAKMTHISHG